MNRAPAFMFYPKDHITTLAALNYEERGAWVTLVSHCWWEGPLSLEVAKRLIGEKLLQSVRFLLHIRKNTVTFDWIEEARKKQAARSDVNATNGRMGGRGNRRGRKRKTERLPNDKRIESKTKPSRAGIANAKRNTIGGKERARASDAPFPFTTPAAVKAWTAFQLMRKDKLRPMFKDARSLIIADLQQMGEAEAIKALNKSVRSGWADVYPHGSIGAIVHEVKHGGKVHTGQL